MSDIQIPRERLVEMVNTIFEDPKNAQSTIAGLKQNELKGSMTKRQRGELATVFNEKVMTMTQLANALTPFVSLEQFENFANNMEKSYIPLKEKIAEIHDPIRSRLQQTIDSLVLKVREEGRKIFEELGYAEDKPDTTDKGIDTTISIHKSQISDLFDHVCKATTSPKIIRQMNTLPENSVKRRQYNQTEIVFRQEATKIDERLPDYMNHDQFIAYVDEIEAVADPFIQACFQIGGELAKMTVQKKNEFQTIREEGKKLYAKNQKEGAIVQSETEPTVLMPKNELGKIVKRAQSGIILPESLQKKISKKLNRDPHIRAEFSGYIHAQNAIMDAIPEIFDLPTYLTFLEQSRKTIADYNHLYDTFLTKKERKLYGNERLREVEQTEREVRAWFREEQKRQEHVEKEYEQPDTEKSLTMSLSDLQEIFTRTNKKYALSEKDQLRVNRLKAAGKAPEYFAACETHKVWTRETYDRLIHTGITEDVVLDFMERSKEEFRAVEEALQYLDRDLSQKIIAVNEKTQKANMQCVRNWFQERKANTSVPPNESHATNIKEENHAIAISKSLIADTFQKINKAYNVGGRIREIFQANKMTPEQGRKYERALNTCMSIADEFEQRTSDFLTHIECVQFLDDTEEAYKELEGIVKNLGSKAGKIASDQRKAMKEMRSECTRLFSEATKREKPEDEDIHVAEQSASLSPLVRNPWGEASKHLPSFDSPQYPIPALILPTIQERMLEIDHQMENVQEFFSATIAQYMAVLTQGFLAACEDSHPSLKDAKERRKYTEIIKKQLQTFEQWVQNAIREKCGSHVKLENMVQAIHSNVLHSIMTFNIQEASIPESLTNLFEKYIVTGTFNAMEQTVTPTVLHKKFQSGERPLTAPQCSTLFSTLPIQTEEESKTDDDKVTENALYIGNALLCGMLRNVCTPASGEKIAISGDYFSVLWIPKMQEAIEETVRQYIDRTPRRNTSVDRYIDRMYSRQVVLSKRAGRSVENALKEILNEIESHPDDKLLTALRGSTSEIKRGESIPSTPEEFEDMIRGILGGRAKNEKLFSQEEEKALQWCIITLTTGEGDMEAQLQNNLPALRQLATEFDHDCHADIIFRRSLNDEELLNLLKPIAAKVLLQRKMRTQSERQKLREYASENLPEHIARLQLLNLENEEWITSWPTKHQKKQDDIGFAGLRCLHEYACAYVQRCEEQGKELPGLALAMQRAEHIYSARERKVIVIQGEEQQSEKDKRAKKTLKQDTKQVWSFLSEREAELDLLLIGASLQQEDIHHEARGPLALFLQLGREAKELEEKIDLHPDHSTEIALLKARITNARSEAKEIQLLLSELTEAGGDPQRPTTEESLAEEAGSLLGKVQSIRIFAEREKKGALQNEEHALKALENAEKGLDEYSFRGGTDQLVTNQFSKTIKDAKEAMEEAQQLIEQCNTCGDILDTVELEVFDGIEKLGEPDVHIEGTEELMGDLSGLIGALQRNAASFSEKCNRLQDESQGTADQEELEERSHTLTKKIEDATRRIKVLEREQRQREPIVGRIKEIRGIIANVSKVISPNVDAE